MIEKITMKNVASYNDEGISLEDLTKINFIYGGNGTGKTTISNFLANLEDEMFCCCVCDWDNENHERIVVYNKKFRDNNIVNKQEISGIFTLGEESVELTREMCGIKESIVQLDDALSAAQRQKTEKELALETLNNNLKDYLWSHIYKPHEALREVFRGYLKKETFCNRILDVISTGLHDIVPIEELEAKYEKLYSSEGIQSIELLDESLFEIDLQTIEENSIWREKIVGKQDVDIAELVNSMGISDWVHQGKDIIESMNNDICPFCQQHTITEKFKQQIADYFDQNFTSKIASINEQKELYHYRIMTLFTSLSLLLSQIELLEISETEKTWMKSNITKLRGTLTSNEELMSAKCKEPSREIALADTSDIVKSIYNKVKDINVIIGKHNSMVANIVTVKNNVKDEVWNFMASQAKDEVSRVKRERHNIEQAIRGLSATITDKAQKCLAFRNELREKESRITSVMPTITSINEMLLQFGFTNFKLVPAEDNGYRIQRGDGSVATETLSEGELTFISFLYFMHLIKGSMDGSSVSEARIVVIDDPVSSLDSDVLFVVSSLLKELLKKVASERNPTEVKQVILLTHNIYFHKEVSFLDRGSIDSRKYWILRKHENVTNVKCFNSDNPIKSSYELLWSELREFKDSDKYITVQNIMRRILETYFTVFGDYFYCDRILSDIDNNDDREIARSLLCWANEGSHVMADDLFAPPAETQVVNYMNIFKMIFDKLGQTGHYNMMMHTRNDATE